MAVGVASAALVASLAGVPAAVAAGAERITFPEGGSFERIAGDSRVDTAIAAAERLYADKGKSLTKAYLVAAGDSHLVDAATSGMLTDGVVLLVPTDRSVSCCWVLRLNRSLTRLILWLLLVVRTRFLMRRWLRLRR
ncbi:Uncharacterised protein [Mobiluncus mulieris]|nr:Uncharacterised protein [Mobiluncus mulieris]